jgi:hypothetical protein
MFDPLVDAVLRALRQQPASTADRWRAALRIGEIAKAYHQEPEAILASVFGPDTLHDDREENPVGNSFLEGERAQ